jgi:hypothetical protein
MFFSHVRQVEEKRPGLELMSHYPDRPQIRLKFLSFSLRQPLERQINGRRNAL